MPNFARLCTRPAISPVERSIFRLAFAGAFLTFAGIGWASTGACLNPSGASVSGCSTVDVTFSGFITPANNDFASPDVTSYLYNPTVAEQGGAGWTFSSIGTPGGGSNDNGALIYGSNWYAGTAPGGPQVAGLQQFSGTTAEASISQEVSGFTVGQSYGVQFYDALRNGAGGSNTPEPGDTIEVLLGGQLLGTFTPSTASWTEITTGSMVATSATMNLEFLSASGGTLSSSEVDTLLDDVLVGELPDPTPEPASLILAAGGLAFVSGWRKLRPRRKS